MPNLTAQRSANSATRRTADSSALRSTAWIDWTMRGRTVAAGESPGEVATDPAPLSVSAQQRLSACKEGEEESKGNEMHGQGASSASDCVALQGRPVKGAPSGRVAEAMAQAPPLSTPGMGDRLGVKVPWRKRWC